MPPTRARPVSAAGAQRRVGSSSVGCSLELSRNPRPLPLQCSAPGSWVGLTESTGFTGTSHSSLTGQEMVADLMSVAQGPHTETGSRRGGPRRVPGQGSVSIARRRPGAPSRLPVFLHRRLQANQSRSLQPLLPGLQLLPVLLHVVQFWHKLLLGNFRAGLQATQERQKG